ncbi:hypothetical protein [Methanorbis furvi]|uniref:Uncharacterized protein n=1 Tax=Methanorbis furvi TaxID=3028299 RepID=A0AAE4ME96_9EURY|nr:hypothetical protein [Methanocorpusculaceae archaeon Ag1]
MELFKKKGELTNEEFSYLMGYENRLGRIWGCLMTIALDDNRFDSEYLTTVGLAYLGGFYWGLLYPCEKSSPRGSAQWQMLVERCKSSADYIAGNELEIRLHYATLRLSSPHKESDANEEQRIIDNMERLKALTSHLRESDIEESKQNDKCNK